MRYLNDFCREPTIADYYNKYVGQRGREKRAGLTNVKRDKYKNPIGSDFDLGRDKKFDGFRVLVGQFFHSKEEKQLSTAVLRSTTQKDLQSKGARKKFWRKNMTGERFRLFNIDPNKTKKSKRATRKKKHKKDPFGRNSRKMHRAQMPKGEGDLFPNGVLPKMEDFR